MSQIPAHVVQEIKERVDIVAVISDYVRLRRAGTTYKGLCPFHQEKTPSFNVHPGKRIFHCFGCGAGGDVISFIRKIDNKEFPEVLERLAGQAGIDLTPYRTRDDGPAIGRIYEAVAAAHALFRKELARNREARAYLADRGIGPELQATFEMGFAPDSWDETLTALRRQKFTDSELVDAGLVRRRNTGEGIYDYFRNRIVIPIHNSYGRVVGFGARVMGEGEPKYLNSPETQIYDKGRLLFNEHRVVQGSTRLSQLLVLEGYLDVVACHGAGVTNAVATLGTAFTERHAKLLEKHLEPGSHVILGYDSDRAGIAATMRAIKIFGTTDVDVSILDLPSGLDPDDTVRKHGPDGIRRAVDGAIRLERYLFNAIRADGETTTQAGRERALRKLTPIFKQLPSLASQQNLVRLISESFGIAEDLVRRALTEGRFGTTPAVVFNMDEALLPNERSNKSPKVKAERKLVGAFLVAVEQYHRVREVLRMAEFEDPYCRRILQVLAEDDIPASGPVYERFIDGADDDPLNRFIAKEVLTSDVADETAARVVDDSLRTLRSLRLEERKSELQRLISEDSDFTKKMEYAKELNEISRTLNDV